MFVEDITRGGYKVYREHDPRIPPGSKNVKRGVQIKKQTEDHTYELENVGDETGWFYWGAKHSRQQGDIQGGKINPDIAAPDPRQAINQGLRNNGIINQAFPGDPGTIFAGIIKGPGASRFRGPEINVAFPGDPGTVLVGSGQAPKLGIVLTDRAFINKNNQIANERKKDVARKINPAEFQKPPAEQNKQQGNGPEQKQQHKRELGSWAQIAPSVGTPQGIMPVGTKTGSVHQDYLPKKVSFGPYVSQQNEVRNINGYNAPHGMPGTLVQGISQTEHEQMFVPAGNILSCDHKSRQGGLSTRVFDVRLDNYIDSSDNQAAGLDSALRVVLDKSNRKVVALNFTKSGLDDTGFGAIVARPVRKSGNGVVVSPDNSQIIVAYLGVEKRGPITAGAENDRHSTGANKDGQASNPAHIDTGALYFLDRDRDGVLDFTTESYPEELLLLEEKKKTDEKTAKTPVKIGFDKKNDKWRLWSENPEGKLFARIRWDYSGSGLDNSEAEILDIDFDKDIITATGRIVWIDYEKSAATQFYTAGDSTIFLLSPLEKNFERNGGKRDIFRAASCFLDSGVRIGYLEMIEAASQHGNLLADDEKPWQTLQSSRIKTTIGGGKKDNRIQVNIPRQWAIGGTADYKFMEISDFSRGLNLWAVPIAPVPADSSFSPGSSKIYESAEKNAGASIAQYLLAGEEI